MKPFNHTFQIVVVLAMALATGSLTSCKSKKTSYVAWKTESPEEEVQAEAPATGIPREKIRPGATENIESSERLEAIRLKPIEDPLEVESAIFRAEVRGMFEEEKFDLLETKASELRKSRELFGGGKSKLAAFYLAINERINHEASDYERDMGIFQNWDKSKPKSLALRIALIDFYSDLAWAARGSGYSNTITESMRNGFEQNLSIAASILAEARALPDKDPCCQLAGMTVALGQGWAPRDYNELVSEAVAIDPTFYEIDSQRAYSLLEKWYGSSNNDWLNYAKKASSRAGGLGDEAYARIVISISSDFADVFRDGGADRKKTMNGLAILRKKYPESLYILNQTARLATMARDRKLAEACFAEIGDYVLPSVWPKKERFVHFRHWARTGNW